MTPEVEAYRNEVMGMIADAAAGGHTGITLAFRLRSNFMRVEAIFARLQLKAEPPLPPRPAATEAQALARGPAPTNNTPPPKVPGGKTEVSR